MILQTPVNENDHAQGAADAPIVLVQYGDFECPYSAASTVAVARAQKHFGERLMYVFRPFPLFDIHLHALRAAEAGEAAAVQGRFWDMYGLLFANQDHLSDKDLAYYASHLKLDLERFNADMAEHVHLEGIAASIQSGRASGAHGTPTFFINGHFFDNRRGLWEEEILLEAIEAAVKADQG